MPARRAPLTEHGSSLLPVGITGVLGSFGEGDVLDIADETGLVIARGIAEASSDELELAAGRRQDELAQKPPSCRTCPQAGGSSR